MNEGTKNIFSKQFNFIKDAYSLPPVEDIFKSPSWESRQLQLMKSNLNAVKSKLNEKKIEEWAEHTKLCNPAGDIVSLVKNGDVRGEFVTQAWCKFYEILAKYRIVSKLPQNRIRSLHVCEAPGGFVAALNHHLKSDYPSKDWEWRATTLNPFWEGNSIESTITDDRFILKTLPSWDFLADYTGNILHGENLSTIKAWSNHSVDLVTADGSVDCSLVPECQESIVAKLHLVEVLTCLNVLKTGGCFILKMFTFFESTSLNLLYLLCCLFERLQIFKPSVSKEGNSEVYVICQGYTSHPNIDEYLAVLTADSRGNAMFPQSAIPTTFLKQIEDACRLFMLYQVEVIQRNLATYERLTQKDRKALQYIKTNVALRYIEMCRLKPIEKHDRISNDEIISSYVSRRHFGSYNDRTKNANGTIQEKIQPLLQDYQPFNVVCKRIDRTPLKIDIKFGAPIHRLWYSKFVCYHTLKLFQECCDLLAATIKCSNASSPVKIKNKTFDIQKPIFVRYLKEYSKLEHTIQTSLVEAIESLEDGDNFEIRHLPVLTHVMAGLIFYLKDFVFDSTVFHSDGRIMFHCKRSDVNVDIKNAIAAVETKENEALVRLIDIPCLYSQNDSFHSAIVRYNESVLASYCVKYLKLHEATNNQN